MRVSFKNVSVSYRTTGGAILPSLGPVSFQIESGQFVCLVGASGSGKSTLIRVLAGLQPPTQGVAYLNDQAITRPSSRVGLMFQEANLMPWRTVIDNITLPLELTGTDRTTRYAVGQEILTLLDLADFSHAYPSTLSGGMAQRVGLGRVLALNPEVLLLDEPFGALDALTREQVSLDLMKVWERNPRTVVMVTHDIHESVLLADRVLVLSRRPGRIVADIEVNLPRPRQPRDIYTTSFIEIARQVRESIV
ncbi:MAG: ABC transporter ATP-binding protein [Anaerolineae bacterium]|jgi:NitT/TauT family transport system ATP-binding protein|nr:ABC transporter ATP-binding protein [Anaerolineae bacterium]